MAGSEGKHIVAPRSGIDGMPGKDLEIWREARVETVWRDGVQILG